MVSWKAQLLFDLPTTLSWLGFNKTPPITNDFYPLFPWLTFYLLGFWVGQIIMNRQGRFQKVSLLYIF